MHGVRDLNPKDHGPGVDGLEEFVPSTDDHEVPTPDRLPRLAEPVDVDVEAVGPRVCGTALTGSTLDEVAVTGPPAPHTHPVPVPVSLVKVRRTYSHPRFGIDDAEEGGAPPAPEQKPPAPPPPSAAPAPRANPGLRLASQVLAIIAVVALGTLLQLTFLGGLQHTRDQAQAFSELRGELAAGTAPVGPLDDNGTLLAAGAPVAILEIPVLHLSEVVLEGSTSRVTMSGPAHRRDTVLPGQAGTSIIIGRRGGYGGPFQDLDRLQPGDDIVVTTGQGRQTFKVLGTRRAGDPLPTPLGKGQGRLTLTTTDGPRFQPNDAMRVDANLTSQVQDAPAQVPSGALPENEAVYAGDPTSLLALMLWGPLLLAAAAGVVFVRHRIGLWQAWLVGVPVLGLLGLEVIDSVLALLPNVL